jgi:hypothetical protein
MDFSFAIFVHKNHKKIFFTANLLTSFFNYFSLFEQVKNLTVVNGRSVNGDLREAMN